MKQTKAGVWLFGVTSVLAFVAALVPLLKGERLNATFVGVGVVFFVLTAVTVKKHRSSGNPPPSA